MSATRAEAAQVPNKDKFEKSISSKPFIFVIGQERKEFHIHKELIGQLSPVLNALVNGNMKEAREGRVEWLDLDVDTFVRFAKFAYSGNYTPAEPELVVPAVPDDDVLPMLAPEEQGDKALTGENSEGGEEDDESSVQDDDYSGSSGGEPIKSESDDPDQDISDSPYSSSAEASSTLDNGRNRHPGRRSIHVSIDAHGIMHSYTALPYSLENYMSEWEKCLHERYKHEKQQLPPRKRQRFDTNYGWAQPKPKPVNKKYEAMRNFIEPKHHPTPRATLRAAVNLDPHESYRPVFLSHARLYILADKYGVNRLRRLTLARLHRTLTHYVVHRDRIPDLIALAQEIFDNTIELDDARTLIVDYFVCIIEDIQGSAELEAALRQGGDFPAALIGKMAFRRM
ncbi:hypothetical protein N0V84_011010 [Fusarium piperis]|uniref:BTB domain-containing protein n=1 Tax=Fusarium piperis TaxID=1435070 RepID=A0A9W8W4G8_9HYPO|nr:hypothetical protein N0V84_011010 [Fusarium piperis]